MYIISRTVLMLLQLLVGSVVAVDPKAANTIASADVPRLFRNGNKCKACHRFDGIGGISGGGATSRLLVEYPEDVQSEILDFLFKPNFGASLHMLKVEIGGDSQSTDGSESTHMHSQDDLNLNRGYEWWMLKEAKKRNPDILTYGLPWAWPGWLSEDKHDPFQHMDLVTNYTLQWVKGARKEHGIEIDYLGVWNERGTSRAYMLALRKVLDDNDFRHIKLVGNDGNANELVPRLVNDTEYTSVVDILGFHYPADDHANIWKLANSFEKPIWAAEESSSYDDLNGAACWARVIASHYVLNNMTANIMWNLVGSYMHGTNWYAASMLTAVQPWTGYYEWEQMPVVWATAHYTQFIQPGWHFLPVGQGSGELAIGGYYLTLVSPDLKYFTVILVKISRDHAPCTRPALWDWDTEDEVFNITIQLPALQDVEDSENDAEVQTWYSNLEQADAPLFVKLDLHSNSLSRVSSKTNGIGLRSYDISLNVTVGSVFTVTNQDSVGNKGLGKRQEKSDAFFPLPYHDDFNDYECDNCYSKYLSDQLGAFEIQFVAASSTGGNVISSDKHRAVVQMTPELPVMWGQSQKDRGPVTVMGMTEWEDIQVEASFRLPDAVSAGCVSTRTDQFWANGVSLCVASSHWFLVYGGANLTGYDPFANTAIAHGNVSISSDEWHTMSLTTLGHQVQGRIDGDLVTPTNTSVRVGDSGFVALGVSTYAPVQFGHIHIKPVGPHWSKPQPAVVKKEPAVWSLSLGFCTPNGFSKDSERFELTANWQIRHLLSGLCVAVLQEESADESSWSLDMQKCKHDYTPQQFRHQYTLIRNGGQYPLRNALGDLCATRDGEVSLTVPRTGSFSLSGPNFSCAGSDDSFFAKWALYPNTQQLRNAFGYSPGLGGRARCLQAKQEEGTMGTLEATPRVSV